MDFGNINLLIGIPAYGCLTHIDNNLTLFSLIQHLKFDIKYVGNESLITRARNTIASFFYHNKQFTHLLFLDADVGLMHNGEFSPYGILRLLNWEKDVIGAPVPLKGTDSNGNLVYNVTSPIQNIEGNLFSVNHIGTAVLLFSRKAIDSLVEDAKINNHVYTSNPHSRGINQKVDVTEQYDIFKVGVVNGTYLSEDYFACATLKNMGYTIYCDDSIQAIHNGNVRIGQQVV